MPDRPTPFVTCPRCEVPLQYTGTRRFHEGTGVWDLLGDAWELWELFKNREHYDVYVCRRCGRIEFFIDGIGEALRGEPSEPEPIVQPLISQTSTADGAPFDLQRHEPLTATGPDWRCPSCGETVPGNFDVCWNCQTSRETCDK